MNTFAGETFDLWKQEENAWAPSFLDQVHVDDTYLGDHDVAVLAGSLTWLNLAAVTLSPTPAHDYWRDLRLLALYVPIWSSCCLTVPVW